MRAFQVTSFTAPPIVADIPTPRPADGDVLLRIEACGVNFADTLMAKGTYQDMPEPPFTLGMEVCGRVVDPNGSALAKGQRVAVFGGQGGLAEYGCFAAERCAPVPDAMPSTTAAGFLVAYGTSHLALTRRARLQPGETLLVLGAAGGVGLTAVEIGKLMGARVIAVARGAAKMDIARRAGADHVIDAEADLTDELRALGGVDVVYDPVGDPLTRAALRAANREGRILVIGFAGGQVPNLPANHLLVKNIDVLGFYWGGYLGFNPAALRSSLEQLMAWYVDGRLMPHISHTLPLDQAGEALDLLIRRRSTGKVVVEM